ncbi:MAG: hypothetical protein HUJ25_13030 [Crocinitomicaceae bacterium]|nr:hypothetical protein [Crocinitomicaceae bacterium]
MKQLILISAVIVSTVSCVERTTPNDSLETKEVESDSSSLGQTDRIEDLISRSFKEDSIEIIEMNPFFYFKSGNFINSEENHILYFEENGDRYDLNLRTQIDDELPSVGKLDSLEISLVQFDIRFFDFNFDGNNDIFIRKSASNGYVLERGYLIEFKPELWKLEIREEVSEYANFAPLPEYKMVYAEKLLESDSGAFNFIGWTYFKWESGKLVPAGEAPDEKLRLTH